MIKSLGIRAHDYGKMLSDELAKAVRADGLTSVQLALNKAISGINNINDVLDDESIIKIGEDFIQEKVDIAVLGCYLNYAHPDKGIRQENLEVFKRHIKYGKLLNARVVGTETGSVMADYSYTKENHSPSAYKIFANSLYVLLQEAQDQKVNIGIEGVYNHIIYSNELMNQLIKDMKSDNLKVILDPVNLLNVNNYKKHDDILKQSYELFGEKIEIIHAKDYKIENDTIVEINHGTGIYDYNVLRKFVKDANENMDILLENADVTNIPNIKKLFEV